MWGSNRQCQLGYQKKLQSVFSPILFAGTIELRALASQEENEEISPTEEKKEIEKDKVVYDYLYDIKYSKILCGKG